MSRCLSPGGRQAIVERLSGHASISPHLPSYYLPPKKAVEEKLLVEGLKSDLDEIKEVQAKEKLAWKGTILSVVVSKGNEESIVMQG